MSTDIRTDTNLVEVVTVRTKPDQDPDEPLIGHVHIWEAAGYIDVAINIPAQGGAYQFRVTEDSE